jgi:hypothetical protein
LLMILSRAGKFNIATFLLIVVNKSAIYSATQVKISLKFTPLFLQMHRMLLTHSTNSATRLNLRPFRQPVRNVALSSPSTTTPPWFLPPGWSQSAGNWPPQRGSRVPTCWARRLPRSRSSRILANFFGPRDYRLCATA